MGKRAEREREWSVVGHEQLLPNQYVMRWDEGMLKQCAAVGQLYHDWIDHPKMRRVRMFDSDYIEAASFTPWWIVPALYIPWGLLELDLAHQDLTHTPPDELSVLPLLLRNGCAAPLSLWLVCASLFCAGVFLWTLFEYLVHKHCFHWTPPSAAWNMLHFIGHGMHHLTPADKYRLVFPPAVSSLLGLAMRGLFYGVLFPVGVRSALFGGFVVGYACYESIHYLAHHCPLGSYLQERFRMHSAHHFNPRKVDKLYGVSTPMWDHVFGTL